MTNKPRKIIHVDMDCFYAAIEIRDNPALADKPVAVGGPTNKRSVLCTCNYIARKYGVHSAMPTAYAERLCPDLIVLPVNMAKYREAANLIHKIFFEFTDLVEPLSLDEAYLDVSDASYCQGSATLMAKEIRQKILDTVKITASAGVSSNKLLAKIASGWKKPNGLFIIPPKDIDAFIKDLPVEELYGVGKVTAEKLHSLSIKTCFDLQKIPAAILTENFGKMGQQLFDQCRGIDNRVVEPNRIKKSLSVEQTFLHDIKSIEECTQVINELHGKLINRIQQTAHDLPIKNQYLKIKYSDFKQASIERISNEPNLAQYKNLLSEIYSRENSSIRLLGIGVHFGGENKPRLFVQQSLL